MQRQARTFANLLIELDTKLASIPYCGSLESPNSFGGGLQLRTARRSRCPNSQPPRYFQRLAGLLLILLSTSGGWRSQPGIAQGQASSVRFAESLKFQEVEPGIEYGQTTVGQATKDERTG